jgi:hypothetical protein
MLNKKLFKKNLAAEKNETYQSDATSFRMTSQLLMMMSQAPTVMSVTKPPKKGVRCKTPESNQDFGVTALE